MMTPRPAGLGIASCLCVLVLTSSEAARGGTIWATLHNDNQRSGFTDEFVEGPYERKWYRDFHDEMIATRVEAIVAEGRCYVGTFAGSFHALDVTDGATAWTFEAGGPIGHSACYADGKLYLAADVGFNRGKLHCVRARDGAKLWEYEAGAGVWVSPAWHGGKVYFGDRAGVFHAVDADTGRGLWTYRTGHMVLTPASITNGGERIVFASEDMHVYCVDPEGRLLWKSAKVQGLSLRDHAPTIWKGLALVRTNPADGFHESIRRVKDMLAGVQKAVPVQPEDKILHEKWGHFVMRSTPRREEAEIEAALAHLRGNPVDRNLFAFRLEDGTEPWLAPVFYLAGLHNPATPPTFNPVTGELYVWTLSALTNYAGSVPAGASALVRLDRETGHPHKVWHLNGDRVGWAAQFAAPADETQSLSLMGRILLNTHQGIVAGLDLDTLRWHVIHSRRDSYGGIYGPSACPGYWKGSKKLAREGYLSTCRTSGTGRTGR